MKPSARVAHVVLDTRLPQLDRIFDYSIPEGMEVAPGCRVKVPLRSQSRLANGFVVSVSPVTSQQALSAIHEVVSDVSVLTPDIWALASQIAQRSAGNVADVLRLAIPPRSVRVEKAWQQQVVTPPPSVEALKNGVAGYPASALTSLLASGSRSWLNLHSHATLGELAKQTVAEGKSAIIVVPDWRDIQALGPVLREWIPAESLSVWDQELSGSERYREFLRCLRPEPVVVLGSRHSIYAPVSHLGVIIVVQDGDQAHQEPLAPYPHSRDIALLRQADSSCAVVYASRVPSLPLVRWIQRGFVQPLSPTNSMRATVVPTALALGQEQSFGPGRIPSTAYQGAKHALKEGPVLVQVYRAGFSPGLACADCGQRRQCTRCLGPIAQKGRGSLAECAWCGLVDPLTPCSECRSMKRKPLGFGVERTVGDLGKAFPGVHVIQSDGESRTFSVPNKPALVVATRGAEPVAEGGYRAALLLDGVAMLQRPSLSALEETLAGWEHAISLVHPSGQVYVTDITGATALSVASGNYLPLLTSESNDREALKLPPAIRFVTIEGPNLLVSRLVEVLQDKFPEVLPLGPVVRGDGALRTVVRFPYAIGSQVALEVRSFYLKNLSGNLGKSLRLRISFDTASTFDSVVNE